MAGLNAPTNNLDARPGLPEWVREAQAKLTALRNDVNRSQVERDRIAQMEVAFGQAAAQANSAFEQGDAKAANAFLQSAAEMIVDIEEAQVMTPTRSKLAALRGALPPMPSVMAA